jgi:hypothetical protein
MKMLEQLQEQLADQPQKKRLKKACNTESLIVLSFLKTQINSCTCIVTSANRTTERTPSTLHQAGAFYSRALDAVSAGENQEDGTINDRHDENPCFCEIDDCSRTAPSH